MPNQNSALKARLDVLLEALSTEALTALIEPGVDDFFRGVLADARSGAGGIWLKVPNSDALVLAHNVGGVGSEIDGKITQPLSSGLVSEAFNGDKTVCHRGAFRHPGQSSEVDKALGQVTAHQIATPFRLFDHTRGVLTVIQTYDFVRKHKSGWGYEDKDIARVENAAVIIGRLTEYSFVRRWLGESEGQDPS